VPVFRGGGWRGGGGASYLEKKIDDTSGIETRSVSTPRNRRDLPKVFDRGSREGTKKFNQVFLTAWFHFFLKGRQGSAFAFVHVRLRKKKAKIKRGDRGRNSPGS